MLSSSRVSPSRRNSRRHILSFVVWLFFVNAIFGGGATAWIPGLESRFERRSASLRMYVDESSSPPPSGRTPPQQPKLRRASFDGVSVSPKGFVVLLNVPGQGYLPLRVTADPQDHHAATSPESLTLIQLLSGVDMAGAILPPDILAKMLVLDCEAEEEEDLGRSRLLPQQQQLIDFIKLSLPKEAASKFSDSHPWFRSRTRLPKVTLDEVQVYLVEHEESEDDLLHLRFQLVCSVEEIGRIRFDPSKQVVLQESLYQYCPSTSLAFVCLALALRYKAPISVHMEGPSITSITTTTNSVCFLPSLEDVQKDYPMFATVGTLQKSSTRVKENIERGFEIHKLMGALRIAQERGDVAAMEKIRAVLDEYDSMADLPTVPMQSDDDSTCQYYEDENTLQ